MAPPSAAGECWPAVKIPSTSDTLSPASRTALLIASTCRLSWLLPGSVPISSLSSPPTLQHTLLHRAPDRVGEPPEPHPHRHVAADQLRIRGDVDQVRQDAWAFLELDHRQHDRRLHLERLVQDLMGDLDVEA